MTELQKKKPSKPKIEDVILEMVKEEHQKSALDFVEFIRSNKLTPAWASANSWKVSCKGECVCYIRTAGTAHYHKLDDGSWHIRFVVMSDHIYELSLPDEAVKIIWNKVRHCIRCSNCSPANRLIINGKEFENVCHQWLVFKNPDAQALDCAKKLVKAVRREIQIKGA